MRTLRYWLIRTLAGRDTIILNADLPLPGTTTNACLFTLGRTGMYVANTTFTNSTTGSDAVWGSTAAYFDPSVCYAMHEDGRLFKYEDGVITEVHMGKKKKRSKAAGKAAAKAKTEDREKKKAKGGKGAR